MRSAFTLTEAASHWIHSKGVGESGGRLKTSPTTLCWLLQMFAERELNGLIKGIKTEDEVEDNL